MPKVRPLVAPVAPRLHSNNLVIMYHPALQSLMDGSLLKAYIISMLVRVVCFLVRVSSTCTAGEIHAQIYILSEKQVISGEQVKT